MAIIRQPSLFTWKEIDAASDLDRLELVLSAMPDEGLMRVLEALRGKGRNDYPVRPMWNMVLAGIVFQHPSVATLLREMLRNAQLRSVCGFDPVLGMDAVPTDEAVSRFLDVLFEQQPLVEEMFDDLVNTLGVLLPDLGENLACDSKAIPSFGKPVKIEELSDDEKQDRRHDVDADWGVKNYGGVHEDGRKWQKVVKWFGYKLHLVVDSTHELPLAFELTQASVNDSPRLVPLVEQNEEHHPEVAARAGEMAADKGYDSADNNTALYDDHGIMPIIDNRHMWRDEPGLSRLLNPKLCDVFTYDESGRVYCSCPETGEQRELFFSGFEKDRTTLKFRCPAAACGVDCKGRKACEKLAPIGVGPYGRVLRVPLDFDRRIFTPVARHTPKWEKSYDKRTSVERVNSRIDQVLGFERHTIRGMKKMKLRVTLALVVMLAMAVGRIKANQADLMRSLTAPVRKAA